LPDRPRLDLDQDMSDEERLDALREHFVEIVDVHEELTGQLETADQRREELKEQVDRIERENEALRRPRCTSRPSRRSRKTNRKRS